MSHWIRKDSHPPTFIPFCRTCDLPVARLMYRVPKADAWTVEFDAQCCGKTQGARITLAEMRRIHDTGEKFYLVVRKGRSQQIAAQAKRA